MNPLAILPIQIAPTVVNLRYIATATLCAWVWDLITGIHGDVRIFSEFGLTLSSSSYLMSKVLTAAHVVCQLLITAAPVGDCHMFARTVTCTAVFGVAFSGLLFFFRVKAVFNHSRGIVNAFFVLWLIQGLGGFVHLISDDAIAIGPTMYCVATSLKTYDCVSVVLTVVFDTTVFVATSTQLLMYRLTKTQSSAFKAFFTRPVVGHISRVLLQSGQLYFLASVFVDVLMLAATLNQTWPPVLRAMLTLPVAPLRNILACKAYRAVLLGLLKMPSAAFFDSTTQAGSIEFARFSNFFTILGQLQSGYDGNTPVSTVEAEGDVEMVDPRLMAPSRAATLEEG